DGEVLPARAQPDGAPLVEHLVPTTVDQERPLLWNDDPILGALAHEQAGLHRSPDGARWYWYRRLSPVRGLQLDVLGSDGEVDLLAGLEPADVVAPAEQHAALGAVHPNRHLPIGSTGRDAPVEE